MAEPYDWVVVERLIAGTPVDARPEDRAEAAQRMADRGWTINQIAEHLGVRATTVRSYITARLGMGAPTRPIKHGTPYGYLAHKKRGEQPCQACQVAALAKQAQKRARRKARQGASDTSRERGMP